MIRTDGPQQRGRHRREPQRTESSMIERVVQINHVAKVVKGGRRFGFSTIVVVGDGAGNVGVSIGKAKEVPESITKGRSGAMKSMMKIKVVNATIPHEIMGRCGATRVLLRPAVPGTGIIAGKSVRAILEAAGIRDVLSKTIGSSNAVNVVKAAMDGLTRLKLPEDIAEMRGKSVGEMFIARRIRRSAKMEEESSSDRAGEAESVSAQPSAQGQRRRESGGRPYQQRPSGSPDAKRSQDRDRRPDRDRDRRPRPQDRRPPSGSPDTSAPSGAGSSGQPS